MGYTAMNHHEIEGRRARITRQIHDAVDDVVRGGAISLSLHASGGLSISGQYAEVEGNEVALFGEQMGTVTRRTMQLDDVVAVETYWGLSSKPYVQKHVAPSLLRLTVMELAIAAVLERHRGEFDPEDFDGRGALVNRIRSGAFAQDLAMNGTSGPEDVRNLEEGLAHVLRRLPERLRLVGEADPSVKEYPFVLVQALENMREARILDAEGPIAEVLKDAKIDPAHLPTSDGKPQLWTNHIEALDVAHGFARMILEQLRMNRPFVERALLRSRITAHLEQHFRPR
jgi:hypothetical protein